MFRKPAKILVIDDEIETTNLISLVLRRAGYKVYSASDWDGILRLLRVYEDTHEVIDLVILDIMMPEKSGFEVMLAIQVVLNPVPPVIFLTAKVGIDDMVKASDLGAAKYMTKPTTPERLVSAVREVLSRNK
jgi:DNA-binding response OmpR family regulator